MASIIKTSAGTWRARVRPAPGEKEVTRHFRTKGEATTWTQQVRADASRGQMLDYSARKITFKDYAETWRGKQPHSPKTATSVEGRLRRDVYPLIGSMPLSSIRPSDIQGAVTTWSRSLAPSTVKVTLATVSSVFRAAVQDRYITANPAVGVKRPRAKKSAMRVLTNADVSAILDKLPLHHQAPVVVAFGTGLRIGEVLGLRVTDVDMLRRELHVRQQRHPDDTLGDPKTTSSVRDVPMPQRVVDALADHMGRFPGEDGLVFGQKRQTFSQAFAQAVSKAGFDGTKFHDLRHSYASHLLGAGVAVPTVQKYLGHETAAITMSTYAHAVPEADDVAMAVLNRVLGESAESPQSSEPSGITAGH